MPALSKDRNTPYKQGDVLEFPVAGSTKIYAGSLVCANTSGYAVPAADTAGFKFLGVAIDYVDNSAGGNGAKTVRCLVEGVFEFNASSITQAMLGATMYVKNDNEFDDSSTNTVACGKLVKFVSTSKGWIKI